MNGSSGIAAWGRLRRSKPGPWSRTDDLDAVVVHPVGDLDQAVRLVPVAPLDGVLRHLHDRLAELHDLLVENGVDWQRCIRKSLRSWSSVISLFSSTWISPCMRPLLHARAPGAGRGDGLEQLLHAVRLGHVGVGADAEAVDPVLHVVERGEHDHGDEHRRAVVRKRRQTSNPLMSGSIRSSSNTSGWCFRASRRPDLAVLGDDRLEFAHPEDPGHQSRLLRMILDDQSRCHRSIPRGASSCEPPARASLRGSSGGPVLPGRSSSRSRDMQLDDVGVVELVVALDRLAFEDARTPDPGELQRVLEVAMDLPGQVQDRAADGHGERLRSIDRLARDFGVDAKHSQ